MTGKMPKKPKLSQDAKAARFIAGGNNDKVAPVGRDLQKLYIKVDKTFLARVDSMAREMGLNRSSFIINSVAEKLRQLEKI